MSFKELLRYYGLLVLIMINSWPIVNAFYPSGSTTVTLTPNTNILKDSKVLFANSRIYVMMYCNSSEKLQLFISYSLWEVECLNDPDLKQSYLIYETELDRDNRSAKSILLNNEMQVQCNNHHIALEMPNNIQDHTVVSQTIKNQQQDIKKTTKQPLNSFDNYLNTKIMSNFKPLYTTPYDGIYVLIIKVEAKADSPNSDPLFRVSTNINIVGPYGHLPAIEYPLLIFYGVMCIVYVIYGLIWLVVSFLQWRDLLRIQFWIGGVILLGMLEKAFFYAHYHSLNNNGIAVPGGEMGAEFVSCAKRTLARMLVIIMSLGFGIVKPRLGPMLHRVVSVGILYLILACIESYLRVMHVKNKRNELLVANIPLAFVDSGICYWIFTSLVQTTRTLRLRRNMVKLSLYRHFTNTLIFAVIASTTFMFFSMRYNAKEYCTPGWHYTWFETAFWHILFSVLLLVIMILWRPTNNNQRYAFTPLLDHPEDEDDDEEEFVSDAYGIKMRNNHQQQTSGGRTPPNISKNTTNEDDDLRWVEENIPSSMADNALPILDSEEEVLNTKFEVSKMQ